eukprot:Em0010g226a
MATIQTIDSLDLDWVSAQVGIRNAVAMTKVKFGTGQGGSCYRFTISTADGSCHSVIAKCPSLDQKNFQMARALHFYDKEVSFYRFLAPELPIRTPKCYFAQINTDDNFLLLLEDLSPSADIDQFTGISLEVAQNGLKELANLHGPTFMKSELLQSSWLHLQSQEEKRQSSAMLSAVFDTFLNGIGKQMNEATLKIVSGVKERLQVQLAYSPPKQCIIHRDFRTDNLLIDARNGEVPLATVDWQCIDVGSPMVDVAYFLVNSLNEEDCAKYENDLIDYYLERLRDYGVEYPRELARREYARYTSDAVGYAVVAWMLLEKTERGERLFKLMLEKGIAAVTRWDALNEMK